MAYSSKNEKHWRMKPDMFLQCTTSWGFAMLMYMENLQESICECMHTDNRQRLLVFSSAFHLQMLWVSERISELVI